MALTDQERERIREEEWVRLQAQADFYKTNPGIGAGRCNGWRYGVAIVAIFFAFILLGDIAERINWNHVLP
jgi:hypothetical protein